MIIKTIENHLCGPTTTTVVIEDLYEPSDLDENKMKEVSVILLRWLSHMGSDKGTVKLKGPKGHVSI